MSTFAPCFASLSIYRLTHRLKVMCSAPALYQRWLFPSFCCSLQILTLLYAVLCFTLSVSTFLIGSWLSLLVLACCLFLSFSLCLSIWPFLSHFFLFTTHKHTHTHTHTHTKTRFLSLSLSPLTLSLTFDLCHSQQQPESVCSPFLQEGSPSTSSCSVECRYTWLISTWTRRRTWRQRSDWTENGCI